MSFDILRDALARMPATGAQGFEGVAANLLSALTKDKYNVARSGEQPADAASAAGDIAIQAKRYSATPLDETEFEGDFHKAVRSFPKLDCYVLAATRTTTQLSVLAEELQKASGVDIILLPFDTARSELPSLCITFWDCIKEFPNLRELGPDFSSWASAESRSPETISVIERLRSNLTDSIPVAATVCRNLRRHLEGRFGIDLSVTRPFRFRIELPTAVVRQAEQHQLNDWWFQRKSRVGVITGEEGMGKSWVASAFAFELVMSSTAIVLWLDSADWVGLQNIEDVIAAGLMQAGFSERELRLRLTRKAWTRWSEKLLVVLDGANERNARDTAQRLMAQLYSVEGLTCRIVFTTRPILWRSDERALWNSATQIVVSRFTEDELQKALLGLPAPIARSELHANIIEVARIPRYFERAIELRDCFKTLTNVSKELILWADLMAKVDAGDAQVTEKLGWSSPADVKRALLKLALAALAVQTTSQAETKSFALLQDSFGNKFESIRLDLAEQRIVLRPNGDDPAPSAEHLTLGFALHLGTLAARHSGDAITDLADHLRKELEPILSNDNLTEAIFVALQLSAFPNSHGYRLPSSARSALLLAWVSSQNSRTDAHRLQFWASQDLTAYLGFVEEVFIEPVSNGWEELIITPLKEIWSQSTDELAVLEAQMRRWLRYVWKSHNLPDSSTMLCEGHSLPVARSQAQLSLSLVALAILSERVIESFLTDIAVAWATSGESTQRHSWPKTPGGPIDETREIGCKDLGHNLGPVLRWRYTEKIRSKVDSLRNVATGDAVLIKGFGYIERAFDELGWNRFSKPEHTLRERKPLFCGKPEECLKQFVECAELAARDDFPELRAEDRAVIVAKIERLFESKTLRGAYSRTFDDLDMENHLGWFARCEPRRLAELGARFRFECLDFREIGPALSFSNHLPFLADSILIDGLLAKAKKCAEREYGESSQRFSWSLLQLHTLAFTCFNKKALEDWLLFSSEHRTLRREIHYYPIPILCRTLLPSELAAFAREQAKCFCDESVDASEPSEGVFDFWAAIAGYGCNPDDAFHKWTAEQVKHRDIAGSRRYYWKLLWFRSASSQVLQDSIADGSILDALGKEGLGLMFDAGRWCGDWTQLRATFELLVEKLSINDVGAVLALADRELDLTRWGHLIFNKALEQVGHPPFERDFWGTTIHTVDPQGRVVASNCDYNTGSNDASYQGLRPDGKDLIDTLNSSQTGKVTEREANEAIRIWREDQERLKLIEHGALDSFGATRALCAWRDLNQASFRMYASELLKRATSDPRRAFHIGGFVVHVVDAVVALDPDLAVSMNALLRESSLKVNVINQYGTDTFRATFWCEAGKGNQRCREICASFIKDAKTDEELMQHAITAQAEGADVVLLSIADELLVDPLAKNRCLAVSCLAWIPSDLAIEKLNALAYDISGWVRKHADWGVEVARHEASIRRHYALTLTKTDRNVVLARLQELQPALTPSARWWRHELENQTQALRKLPTDTKAALEFFWHDSKNELKKARTLFGRKIEEYFRGERIKDLRSPEPRLSDYSQRN